MNSDPSLPPAPLWRRLAAAGYDVMLLAALWMVVTGLVITIYGQSGLPMDETGGVSKPPAAFLRWGLFPLLMLASWGFFAWFWLHGGQTLGMRAWRICSRDWQHGPMRFSQTLLRFILATLSWLLLGLGYLMVLFPPYQSLHDRLSKTQTVVLPRQNKAKEKPEPGSEQ